MTAKTTRKRYHGGTVVGEKGMIRSNVSSSSSEHVQKTTAEELGGCGRIRLVEPLDVLDFHNCVTRSSLILTEAAAYRKSPPVSNTGHTPASFQTTGASSNSIMRDNEG